MTFDIPFFKNHLHVLYSSEGLKAIEWRKGAPKRPQTPSDTLGQKIVDELHAYMEGRSAGGLNQLPVDWKELGLTPFQEKVLKRMHKIPYGKTRTYAELAAAAGSPKAARAVGSVCARNPILLAIPCHRVLSSQGLGGFSGGGLDVKRTLLKLESLPL